MATTLRERPSLARAAREGMAPALRRRIETAIESLVALLDQVDALHEGLEPAGDEEPWLGWTLTGALAGGCDGEAGDDNGLADQMGLEEQRCGFRLHCGYLTNNPAGDF